MTKGFQRFPDFGKELRRPFEVAGGCLNCAAFYDGCKGWPATREFACRHLQPLPDVMPGTYGQRFPEKVFVPANPTGDMQPAKERRETPPRPTPGEPKPKDSDENAKGPRRCKCGAPLAKGKRYCDTCRAERRRATMRTYMQNRRGSPAQPTASLGSPQKATVAGAR